MNLLHHCNAKNILKLLLMFILPFIASCDREQNYSYYPEFNDGTENKKVRYIFGVHPLHNPQRLNEVFGPLMVYLSENISGSQFVLEASRNYASYDKKLYAKRFHFSLPNPFQTMNAIDKGYNVFAKMGDDKNFRGIILVRKDSNIKKVSDLKGKAVSYPAPTALAATMMPQAYLQKNGVSVLYDLDNRYVGSQESSIMNVFLGQTSAASTWPPPWNALRKERPELDEQLEIKWETKPLLNNGLVVLPTVKNEIVEQVKSLLINLHKTKKGKNILKRMELSKFELANNETYQPVRDFMVTFVKNVRSLK